VVTESTAQYWKPVWGALERCWKPICEKREGAGRMSGKLTSGASLVPSWSTRAQARLPRWRAFSEAAGIAGAKLELRAGYRATPVADTPRTHSINERVKRSVCRINWRRCWKKPTLSCPVWFRTCSVPAHDGC
jgi:hypothetical protein